MNRIVQNTLLALAAQATALFALPYHLGVPLTYQVTRGSGAERAVVVHVPIDSVFHKQDTVWDPSTDGATLTRRIRPDRTLWTIAIRDSLVSGERVATSASWYYPFQSMKGDSIRLDTAVLTASDSTKAWTQASCLAPLDLESWATNKAIIPTPDSFSSGLGRDRATLAWGGLAAVCHYLGKTSPLYTTANSTSRTLSSPWGGARLSGYNATHPMPRGHWSDDSGWVFQEDPASGELWELEKIGKNEISRGRRWLTRPKIGDEWVWRVVDSFSRQDSASKLVTVDTHEVRLVINLRLEDHESRQRWQSTLFPGGIELVSFVLEFDTIGESTLITSPDSFFTALNASFTLGKWDSALTKTHVIYLPVGQVRNDPRWNVHTLTSSYTLGFGAGLLEYRQEEYLNMATEWWMFPTVKTTRYTLISHNGVMLEETGVRQRAHIPQPVALRGLSDLESLLAKGGTLLRMTDSRGRILATNSRTLPQALKGSHGMFFVQAKSASGALGEARFVLP